MKLSGMRPIDWPSTLQPGDAAVFSGGCHLVPPDEEPGLSATPSTWEFAYNDGRRVDVLVVATQAIVLSGTGTRCPYVQVVFPDKRRWWVLAACCRRSGPP